MAQTYDDIEIIVLDNASQDDTQLIVEQVSSCDKRVKYHRHEKNMGLIGNLDACIEFASGKYVKILCADDVLNPNCVASMATVLDQNKEISLVACARAITDENLSTLRTLGARQRGLRVAGPTMITNCFFFGNRIGEPTATMFRRADSQRGFNHSYPQLADMEMWFHLLSNGDFFAVPHSLCSIRAHAGQATWDNDSNGRIVGDRKRLFREFEATVGNSAGFFRKVVWDVRMAYAVMRSASAGDCSVEFPMSEVFFRRAFPICTYPFMNMLGALGLRRIWRTI
jgi:glycosyltransferase involved in cell wall biosynthesis